jgi:hypothetical protein
MAEAISNTSPLFYPHRIGALEWLPRLFSDVWISNAVLQPANRSFQSQRRAAGKHASVGRLGKLSPAATF